MRQPSAQEGNEAEEAYHKASAEGEVTGCRTLVPATQAQSRTGHVLAMAAVIDENLGEARYHSEGEGEHS
jgi:hypothetical protein